METSVGQALRDALADAAVVRINARESDVPAGHVGVAMSAEAALTAIAAAVVGK
jgi:hypothetical protein